MASNTATPGLRRAGNAATADSDWGPALLYVAAYALGALSGIIFTLVVKS